MKKIILILLCFYCSLTVLYSVDFPKIQILRTSDKAATGYYYIGGIETKLSIMDLYGNIVKPTELTKFDLSTCFEKQVNGMFTMFHSPSMQWYVLDKNLKLIDS